MTFRNATPGDIDTLVRLRIAFLEDDHDGPLAPDVKETLESQLRGYFPGHLGRDFFAVLAEEEGQVVASAYLVVVERPANAAFPTGRTAILLNVYTAPAYRRRGAAKAVVLAAIDRAREQNVSILELMATEPGRPLYEKLGFTPVHSHCLPMEMNLLQGGRA